MKNKKVLLGIFACILLLVSLQIVSKQSNKTTSSSTSESFSIQSTYESESYSSTSKEVSDIGMITEHDDIGVLASDITSEVIFDKSGIIVKHIWGNNKDGLVIYNNTYLDILIGDNHFDSESAPYSFMTEAKTWIDSTPVSPELYSTTAGNPFSDIIKSGKSEGNYFADTGNLYNDTLDGSQSSTKWGKGNSIRIVYPVYDKSGLLTMIDVKFELKEMA